MAEAQYNLGVCYKRGEGVAQSDVEAAKWYKKAAEQNNANAQFNLALCYIKGQGVAKDDLEAHKWMLLSSMQGFEEAKNVLTKVEPTFSQKQIEEAKRRANDWLEKQKKP